MKGSDEVTEKGWIKLHRKMLDCWIWQEKPFDKGRAWIDLLLLAMHHEKKLFIDGEILVVPRGSFMTSIVKLSDRWGWSRNKVNRYLELLESEQMLNTQRTPKGTLVTIVKYEDYQLGDTTDDTTDETPFETPLGTSDGTSGETPLGTQNKNIKNYKNVKNEKEITRACACETFNVEKAWKDTFEQYPKKTSAVAAKTAWMDILIDTPEQNRKDVAVLIINAVRIYVDDYAKRNPDDKAFRYIPKFETWLKEDCPYWVTQFEQSQRAVAEDD